MYKKMYLSLAKLLSVDLNGYDDMGSPEETFIAKGLDDKAIMALSLGYGFKPEDIIQSYPIIIENLTPILTVVANLPEGHENTTRFFTYLMIDGKPLKVVVFNNAMLKSEDALTRAAAIVDGMRSVLFTPMECNKNIYNVDIMYYSHAVMGYKLLETLCPLLRMDQKIAAISYLYPTTDETGSVSYNANVTEDTITSLASILEESNISQLLDNSCFLGTKSNIYPNLWFADIDKDNSAPSITFIKYKYTNIIGEYHILYTVGKVDKDTLPEEYQSMFMFNLVVDSNNIGIKDYNPDEKLLTGTILCVDDILDGIDERVDWLEDSDKFVAD